MSTAAILERRDDPFADLFGTSRGSNRLDFAAYVSSLGTVRLSDEWHGIWEDGCTEEDISRDLPKLCELLGLDLIYLWDEAMGDSEICVRDEDGCLHEAPADLHSYLIGEGASSIDLSTTNTDVTLRPHEYARGPVGGDYNYVFVQAPAR